MNTIAVKTEMKTEEVVRPSKELAGIKEPGGAFVSGEELGAGVIYDVQPGGEMLVHWARPDFDAWMLPSQLERLDPAVRLIAIYEQDGHEKREFKHYKIATRAGLCHSWSVELFPDNVVRTIRSDGSAWTFEWLALTGRAYPIHTRQENLPTDDDAEALTAAEIALSSEP